jgi:hypothetical protein
VAEQQGVRPHRGHGCAKGGEARLGREGAKGRIVGDVHDVRAPRQQRGGFFRRAA